MRFYVFNPVFFLRPKNTDWLYNCSLPLVSQFTDDFEIYLQRALIPTFKSNLRLAAAIASRHFHLPLPDVLNSTCEDKFSLRDLRGSRADVVFGHSPSNVRHLPLICHMGPTDEENMLKRGVPQSAIDEEKAKKLRAIRRSHLVTLNSRFGVENVCALAPDAAEKIRSIPFFMPHLTLAPRSTVEEKFAGRPKLKLLFVGREARRKGLPAVLAAFQKADQLYAGRLELSVVSSFAGGAV